MPSCRNRSANIEIAKAVAKTILELLLAHRQHPGIGDIPGQLFGCKKTQGIAWIIEDQVLEILIMTHAMILQDARPGIDATSNHGDTIQAAQRPASIEADLSELMGLPPALADTTKDSLSRSSAHLNP